jgi:hypothetical protein
MTIALENGTRTILQLIESCRHSQCGFQTAAQVLKDETLKRLFGLYAQQRARFAEELREIVATSDAGRAADFGEGVRDAEELFEECLARDRSTLEVYRAALAEPILSRRVRFLVGAQLALLEKAHHRIEGFNQPRATTRDFMKEQGRYIDITFEEASDFEILPLRERACE